MCSYVLPTGVAVDKILSFQTFRIMICSSQTPFSITTTTVQNSFSITATAVTDSQGTDEKTWYRSEIVFNYWHTLWILIPYSQMY